ncbi:MAG: DUF2339 domain-containing protein [Elusimicrobiota bacterium]|jgi:hypothetical protein|nr:DUF2339 domain-containing protein [Elusimicrobiota bacterium]
MGELVMCILVIAAIILFVKVSGINDQLYSLGKEIEQLKENIKSLSGKTPEQTDEEKPVEIASLQKNQGSKEEPEPAPTDLAENDETRLEQYPSYAAAKIYTPASTKPLDENIPPLQPAESVSQDNIALAPADLAAAQETETGVYDEPQTAAAVNIEAGPTYSDAQIIMHNEEQKEESSFKLPKIDWESFTGPKLFSWIGGIALFFGVAFFVKYSIDNSWITPALRIILSIAAAIGCIAGSLFIKNPKYKTTADTLASAGVAVLYASIFAAQYFYSFIGLQSAFVLMSIVSLCGYLLAQVAQSKAVAVLSTIAGFLLPFINGLPYEKQLLVFGFIFILNAGAAASAVKNKWDIVVKLCVAGTFINIISWFANFFSPEKYLALAVIISVFSAGAGVLASKFKDSFEDSARIFLKTFILCGTLFGAIIFVRYCGGYILKILPPGAVLINPIQILWTGLFLMALPVIIYKLIKDRKFTVISSAVMTSVIILRLALLAFGADYKNIIALLILPVIFFIWELIDKEDKTPELKGFFNTAGAGALTLIAIASCAGAVPYFVFAALAVLVFFNFTEDGQKTYRPWIIFSTFAAQFFWALRSENLGPNILLLTFGAFSLYNFVLAKIAQFQKRHMENYAIACTLPFLAIIYLYINFRPEISLVLKCSAFMILMFAAAVHFALKELKGKYLYLPLGAALICLFTWNIKHLTLDLLPLSGVWTALAVLIPFITMLLTRLGKDKNIKDIFVYYTLASMITPIYMLQKTGGACEGFILGFILVLLINICLIFTAVKDKENYGKKLLAFIFGATFIAELTWTVSHYQAYNIYLILGVFAFFMAAYALLIFALRKYETKESDDPAGIFVLATMACANFMSSIIEHSAQIVFGNFGFLLMSSILLVALVYKRKNHGLYILAAAAATFLFEAVWSANGFGGIYVQAGALLPFIIFYTVIPLLKGITENIAKISSSCFLIANTFLVLAMLSGNASVPSFHISAGMFLTINLALAFLVYRERVLHIIQFRAAGVMAFLYGCVLVSMLPSLDVYNGSIVTLFFILCLINGFADYIYALKNKTEETGFSYIISIVAFFALFATVAGFKTAWLFLSGASVIFLWFNIIKNKQIASIAVFAGYLLVVCRLPSSAPLPGIIYAFAMALLFMAPAFLSKAEKKDILQGITFAAGISGFIIMYAVAVKYNFWPKAHGLWPLLWAAVYGAGSYLLYKQNANAKMRFLFNTATLAFLIAAVPMQFEKQWITIFWAVEGVAFMLAGLLKSSKYLRIASTVLLMTVVLKLFFIDLWHLGGLYRVGAFMGTAVMLIAVSFFYQKFIREK